jgi:multisite-specific tRNA:(cytosine-C5)-methyltransferase
MGYLYGLVAPAASNHVPDSWQQTVRLVTILAGTYCAHCDARIAQTLGNTIKDIYVPLLHDVTFEDEVVPPPAQIPW